MRQGSYSTLSSNTYGGNRGYVNQNYNDYITPYTYKDQSIYGYTNSQSYIPKVYTIKSNVQAPFVSSYNIKYSKPSTTAYICDEEKKKDENEKLELEEEKAAKEKMIGENDERIRIQKQAE